MDSCSPSWPICRRAGLVLSQRGQAGGWRLAAAAAEVTIAEVIRAVDGPLVSVHGLRPESVAYNDVASVLQSVWIAARSSLRSVLEQVTIADLAARRLPPEAASRANDSEAWLPH